MKAADVKSVVHYDTTTRSSIDGEWTSIVLNFSDGREYRLRPLFFAYEDRKQIADLFVETYTRPAEAATAADITLDSSVTALSLWENTNALMTDAVSKNLKIDDFFLA